MISATLAMYSSEAHITNYISFLEAAMSVYEEHEARDPGHSGKVGVVAHAICTALNLEEHRRTSLSYACKFHDIGMMGALCDIAAKDSIISEKEHSRIKYHSIIGYTITKPLDSVYPISSTILHHHEFLDETGYPEGVSTECISLDAKILAFSEVLIGMLSDRPHRKGRSYEDSIRELKTMVPHKLDREVFDAFLAKSDEIREALQKVAI
jgi:HD-GYP domain-containing protein (c-di-GMP phosphodiesterase class II)